MPTLPRTTSSRAPSRPLPTRLSALLSILGLGLGLAVVSTGCEGQAPPPTRRGPEVGAAPATAPAPTAVPATAAVAPPAPAPATAPATPAPTAVATPAPASAAAAASPRRPLSASPRPSAGLRVVEAVLARNVEGRVPQGVSARFPTDVGRVWAFVRVANPGPPTHIFMVWRRDGVERARVQLRVGTSSGWRTWSRKRVGPRDAGGWTVDVLGADERPLGTLRFTLSPVAGAPTA